MIFAVAGVLLGHLIQEKFDILSLLLGLAGSAIGLFGMHYWQKTSGTLGDIAPDERLAFEAKRKSKAEYANAPAADLPLNWPPRPPKRQKNLIYSKLMQILRHCIKSILGFRWSQISEFSKNRLKICPPRYYLFALFGLLYAIYPLFSPDAIYVGSTVPLQSNLLFMVELALRVLCIISCINLAIRGGWRNGKQRPLLWHGLLLVCLPLLASYSYYADPNRNGAAAGVMINIFMLALFADYVSFMLIAIVGFFAGYALYNLIALMGSIHFIPSHPVSNTSLIYTIAALGVAGFMRYAQDKQVLSLHNASQAIAQDVQRQNTLVCSSLEIIKKAWQEAVHIAAEKVVYGRHAIKVRPSQQVIIMEEDSSLGVYNAVESSANKLQNSMRLTENRVENITIPDLHEIPQEHSMLRTVFVAIAKYPMTSSERLAIRLQHNHNFRFTGSVLQMEKVIHNLITYSFMHKAFDTTVHVWAEDNKLHYQYHSYKMPPSNAEDMLRSKDDANSKILAVARGIIQEMAGTMEIAIDRESRTVEFIITMPEVVLQD